MIDLLDIVQIRKYLTINMMRQKTRKTDSKALEKII